MALLVTTWAFCSRQPCEGFFFLKLFWLNMVTNLLWHSCGWVAMEGSIIENLCVSCFFVTASVPIGRAEKTAGSGHWPHHPPSQQLVRPQTDPDASLAALNWFPNNGGGGGVSSGGW